MQIVIISCLYEKNMFHTKNIYIIVFLYKKLCLHKKVVVFIKTYMCVYHCLNLKTCFVLKETCLCIVFVKKKHKKSFIQKNMCYTLKKHVIYRKHALCKNLCLNKHRPRGIAWKHRMKLLWLCQNYIVSGR